MYLPSYFEQELEHFISSKLAENLVWDIPWFDTAMDNIEVSVVLKNIITSDTFTACVNLYAYFVTTITLAYNV